MGVIFGAKVEKAGTSLKDVEKAKKKD